MPRLLLVLLTCALAGCAAPEKQWIHRVAPWAERIASPDTERWAPAHPERTSRWTSDVDPANPRPVPPRGGWWRERWQSLNGPWQFAEAGEGDAPPFGVELVERVLVPFAPASSLSGLGRAVDRAWYRRAFRVPDSWGTERVLLHFGAVSREARVWLDGVELGSHAGVWDSFSFDATDVLLARGLHREHEILVHVRGPARSDATTAPGTGIWQTVWLEPVPRVHVAAVDVTPRLDAETLELRVDVAGSQEPVGFSVEVHSFEASEHVLARGTTGETLTLDPGYSRRWRVEDTFAYIVVVRLDGGAGADRVAVWTCIPDADPRAWIHGGQRVGVVDRGVWADGLHTAPTWAALEHSKARSNRRRDFVRKRAKVEEWLWYAIDECGYRILQDLPPAMEDSAQYLLELRRIVESLRGHVRIAAWVVPEEGLGATERATAIALVRQLDSTRPILDANGWIDVETGEAALLSFEPVEPGRAVGSGGTR